MDEDSLRSQSRKEEQQRKRGALPCHLVQTTHNSPVTGASDAGSRSLIGVERGKRKWRMRERNIVDEQRSRVSHPFSFNYPFHQSDEKHRRDSLSDIILTYMCVSVPHNHINISMHVALITFQKKVFTILMKNTLISAIFKMKTSINMDFARFACSLSYLTASHATMRTFRLAVTYSFIRSNKL